MTKCSTQRLVWVVWLVQSPVFQVPVVTNARTTLAMDVSAGVLRVQRRQGRILL